MAHPATRYLAGITLGLSVIACRPRARSTAFHVVGAAASASEWSGARPSAVRAAAATPSGAGVGDGKPWVLHIGDSFVEAFLEQNIAPRFKAAGARYVVQSETATYTTTWASSRELDAWLDLRPSLVLITLGANEVSLPAPEMRSRAVERLVQRISAATPSCVWITPLTWNGDTGILQVIYDHCGPCLFFDSDAVVGDLSASERQADRIHPSPRGGARWASAFWDWLSDHRDPGGPPWSLTRFERRL